MGRGLGHTIAYRPPAGGLSTLKNQSATFENQSPTSDPWGGGSLLAIGSKCPKVNGFWLKNPRKFPAPSMPGNHFRPFLATPPLGSSQKPVRQITLKEPVSPPGTRLKQWYGSGEKQENLGGPLGPLSGPNTRPNQVPKKIGTAKMPSI